MLNRKLPMSLCIHSVAYVSSVLVLFGMTLFIHTAHAGGGGGYALESTQRENRDYLDSVQRTNDRMRNIMGVENPAQFEANMRARKQMANEALKAFFQGDQGNPRFVQQFTREAQDRGRRAVQREIAQLPETYKSPYVGQIQSNLARQAQPQDCRMSNQAQALAQGQRVDDFWGTWETVTTDPRCQTGLGQYYAAARDVNQARRTAEQDFRSEAVGRGMINPVQQNCDEYGLDCQTSVPASLVERIAGDAVTAGSRLQELGDQIGEEVDQQFAGKGNEVLSGSSQDLGIGQDLGMNAGDLFSDLGLDPAEFGLDPESMFNDAISEIGGEFGIGNIDLSNPEAAAQSIANAIGQEAGLGNLDVSNPEAFAQSVFNTIGNEMGIGNINLSNPQAAAQSVMNAVGSELGIGNINLSNPQAAAQSVFNAVLQKIGEDDSASVSNPSEAADVFEDAAEDDTSNSADAAAEAARAQELIEDALAKEEEYYELLQDAQDSGSTALEDYVNETNDEGLNRINKVLSNIVSLNDLLIRVEAIRTDADGNYTDADTDAILEILNEYADLRSELFTEADIALVEEELNNL
jgi:hypothetical protein